MLHFAIEGRRHRRRISRTLVAWVLIPLFAWAAAGASEARDLDPRLEVVVTIAPQKWLVEQIGGDRVDVTALVAPGDSPATYLPSDAQVSRLIRAVV